MGERNVGNYLERMIKHTETLQRVFQFKHVHIIIMFDKELSVEKWISFSRRGIELLHEFLPEESFFRFNWISSLAILSFNSDPLIFRSIFRVTHHTHSMIMLEYPFHFLFISIYLIEPRQYILYSVRVATRRILIPSKGSSSSLVTSWHTRFRATKT